MNLALIPVHLLFTLDLREYMLMPLSEETCYLIHHGS
jgi:hypothetical protein